MVGSTVGIFAGLASLLQSLHYYILLHSNHMLFSFFKQAGAEISTVKPEQYAKRFFEFVCKIIE